MSASLVDQCRCSPGDLPALPRRQGRADWIDIAKGVSISLVVFWHVVGPLVPINEALIFLRMPLFFFLAGLFLRGVFRQPSGERFVFKFANFVYLFVLWSALVFFTTTVPQALLNGESVSLAPLVRIFIEPPQTLWFIYALLIAVTLLMVLRRVPLGVILAVSVVIYSLLSADGNWRSLPFPERVLLLFPFIVMGVFSLEFIEGTLLRVTRFWPLMLTGFVVISWGVYHSGFAAVGPVTFLLSVWGISSVLMMAGWLATRQGVAGRGWAFVGRHSLQVYVLHRIVQFYLLAVLARLGLQPSPEAGMWYIGFYLSSALVVVVLSVLTGWLLAKTSLFAPLFEVPWVKTLQARRAASAVPR
ncbi:acyltransferase family protein [Marinobacter sp.]|uniref:acyltransferase family protein n=1 Tax=Marinobacter sp. TaxID=50741 RepID=UPI003566B80A